MIYWMQAAVRLPRKGLVLCLFLALHLAVSKVDNRVLVVGSTDPVRGIVGRDVILPCFLRPTTSAVEESVEWQRPVLEPKEVHLYRDRSDDNVIQYPSYSVRTSLFREELKNGNVSLKLTNVKLSDAGNYTCYIPTLGHQKTTIELYVGGAAPRPWLSIVRTKDKEVVLKCEAEGLVYKPELVLLNSKGTLLPADEPTERPMDSEGLYTVTRYFTVQKTATNVFTCRVQQLEIKHMRETQIHVPDKIFQEEYPLGWKVGIGFLGAVVGGVVGAVVVFLFMRRNAEETNSGHAAGCNRNAVPLVPLLHNFNVNGLPNGVRVSQPGEWDSQHILD
ncbi:myelin-oligodendrocyte glycoprotein-like isoform X2 [Oncorhynchus keta]|uniref:myelin-oligodendrocyte glycoprotein-like isoform X2 n=1 Tax=Oncorhynchus keta TaxID=8018 RepID=UPI00227B319B|nr:myelin-oligodendrocyte glycoprotein-like isoform X2 [Oncorhynchus keta]